VQIGGGGGHRGSPTGPSKASLEAARSTGRIEQQGGTESAAVEALADLMLAAAGGRDALAALKLCDDAAEVLWQRQRRAWDERHSRAEADGSSHASAGGGSKRLRAGGAAAMKKGHALVDACWRKVRRLGEVTTQFAAHVDELTENMHR